MLGSWSGTRSLTAEAYWRLSSSWWSFFQGAVDGFLGFAEFGAGFVVRVVVQAFGDGGDALVGFAEGVEGHGCDLEVGGCEGGVDLEDVVEVGDAFDHLAFLEATSCPSLPQVERCAGDEDGGAGLSDAGLPVARFLRIRCQSRRSFRFVKLRDFLTTLLPGRDVVPPRAFPLAIPALDLRPLRQRPLKPRLQHEHLIEIPPGLHIAAEG